MLEKIKPLQETKEGFMSKEALLNKVILVLSVLSLVLFPNVSKLYKNPELTPRELWEIRGKWSLQLRELNREVDKIEVKTVSNPNSF